MINTGCHKTVTGSQQGKREETVLFHILTLVLHVASSLCLSVKERPLDNQHSYLNPSDLTFIKIVS